jgi:hypothetical protein
MPDRFGADPKIPFFALRALSPAELAHSRTGFDDDRLEELVFRYRARNFPETLSPEDAERWEAHRVACLLEGEGGASDRSVVRAEERPGDEAHDPGEHRREHDRAKNRHEFSSSRSQSKGEGISGKETRWHDARHAPHCGPR